MKKNEGLDNFKEQASYFSLRKNANPIRSPRNSLCRSSHWALMAHRGSLWKYLHAGNATTLTNAAHFPTMQMGWQFNSNKVLGQEMDKEEREKEGRNWKEEKKQSKGGRQIKRNVLVLYHLRISPRPSLFLFFLSLTLCAASSLHLWRTSFALFTFCFIYLMYVLLVSASNSLRGFGRASLGYDCSVFGFHSRSPFPYSSRLNPINQERQNTRHK
jgi:hypothetical protein